MELNTRYRIVEAGVCTTCNTPFSSCANGNSCCWGGGCPSNICGTCNCIGGWVWDGHGSTCGPCIYNGYEAFSTCPGGCYDCGSNAGGGSGAYLSGYVYQDTNGNGVMDKNIDTFFAPITCSATNTRVAPGLYLYNSYKRNGKFITRYATWTCDTDGLPNYVSPKFGAHTTIIWRVVPTGAGLCSELKYDGVGTYNNNCAVTWVTQDGTYNANFRAPAPAPIPRQVTGKIFETTDPSTCSDNGTTGLTGLVARTYDTSSQPIGNAGTVQADGTFAITGLTDTSIFSSLGINGSLSTGTKDFVLSCVRATGATCTVTSGVASCPNTSLAAGNVTVNFGYLGLDNDKWCTVLDSDIYAAAVSTQVAATPLGGFSPHLINSHDASTLGGFGFSGSTIDTQTAGTSVAESNQGGYAQSLNVPGIAGFEDAWLNSFTFTEPGDIIGGPPAGNVFEEGKVYVMGATDFNAVLAQKSYSIADNYPQAARASIVYVTGGGNITIKDVFKNSSANEMLLVVTNANVTISDSVSIPDIALMTIDSASQIDLGIITSGDITFQSKYDKPTNTYDLPIVVNGFMVTRGILGLNRNLGSVNNSNFPAEYVKFYPYLIDLIRRYELANKDIVQYTGLATYDVQFNYAH